MTVLAWCLVGTASYLLMAATAAFVIGRGIRIADDRLAATLEPARNAPAGRRAA